MSSLGYSVNLFEFVSNNCLGGELFKILFEKSNKSLYVNGDGCIFNILVSKLMYEKPPWNDENTKHATNKILYKLKEFPI
jgi:hypothetical protein